MRLAEEKIGDFRRHFRNILSHNILVHRPKTFSISALHQRGIRLSNNNILNSTSAVSAVGRPERVWQL